MASDDAQPKSSVLPLAGTWPKSAAWQHETRERQVERKKMLKDSSEDSECSDSSEEDARMDRMIEEVRRKRRVSTKDDEWAEGRIGVCSAIEVCLDRHRVEGSFATTLEPTRRTTMVLGRPVQVERVMDGGWSAVSC